MQSYHIFYDRRSRRLVYTTSEEISARLAEVLGVQPMKMAVKGPGAYTKIEGNAIAGKDFLSEMKQAQ